MVLSPASGTRMLPRHLLLQLPVPTWQKTWLPRSPHLHWPVRAFQDALWLLNSAGTKSEGLWWVRGKLERCWDAPSCHHPSCPSSCFQRRPVWREVFLYKEKLCVCYYLNSPSLIHTSSWTGMQSILDGVCSLSPGIFQPILQDEGCCKRSISM